MSEYKPAPEIQAQRDAFASWLRKHLDERSWRPSDASNRMSELAGKKVYPSLIRKWLNALQLPKPVQCALLADALSLPHDAVLEAAGHRERPEPIVNPFRREAIDLVALVPDNYLPTLVPMLRGLTTPMFSRPRGIGSEEASHAAREATREGSQVEKRTALTAISGNSITAALEGSREVVARIEDHGGEIVETHYSEGMTEHDWHVTLLLIYRIQKGKEEAPVIRITKDRPGWTRA